MNERNYLIYVPVPEPLDLHWVCYIEVYRHGIGRREMNFASMFGSK